MDCDPGSGVVTLTTTLDEWGWPIQNIYVSKLDASGNYAWAKKIGGDNYCYVSDVSGDTSGNVYTIGNYSGTTDFNPGVGIYNLELRPGPDNYSDMFVSKLDQFGNMGWARSISGSSNENPSAITVDIANNVLCNRKLFRHGRFQSKIGSV